MTDPELLARARVFDAGPLPVNGLFVVEEDDDDGGLPMTVECRGTTGWAICHGQSCLTKRGDLIYETMPSHRTQQFIRRTRFPSPQQAFAHLEAWKIKERKRALKKKHFIRWKEYKSLTAEQRRALVSAIQQT